MHCSPTGEASGSTIQDAVTRQARDYRHWVATWAASPQPASFNTPSANQGLADETVRELVFTSIGGRELRVRFANTFGPRPLAINAAAVGVARPGGAVSADVRIKFAGRDSVLIPAGAEAVSDPVHLGVPALTDLAVSVFVCRPTGPATLHVAARQVNYVVSGNHVLDRMGGAFSTPVGSWYFLSGVDVLAPRRVRGAIVALGDSITDGVRSPVNANARWPNDLARRFANRPGATLGIVDEGISGNRVLSGSACYGPSGVSRFNEDVLSNPGVRLVVLLEGVNDIGLSQTRGPCGTPHTSVSAQQIIDGDERMIDDAHARGLRIIGATILPFRGARYWTPAGEAKREAINEWIRTSGAFDGVIDFAPVVADPSEPERLAPGYDSGDHLHPDAAGYAAMAGSVDLSMLLRAAASPALPPVSAHMRTQT